VSDHSIVDSLPFPVYAITKDVTEIIAKKNGMSEDDAKILGTCVGAAASLITTCTTGVP
jgi:hypothetical protein